MTRNEWIATMAKIHWNTYQVRLYVSSLKRRNIVLRAPNRVAAGKAARVRHKLDLSAYDYFQINGDP